jgi:nucleotide-binding universal stress UspA family protein
MIDFKRILCPVDTSEFSERALRYAAALSRLYGADLTVLSVRPLALPPALWMEYPVGPLLEPGDLTAEEERVRAFIQTVAGPSSAKVAVRDGSVAPEILQAARDLGSDLVVMGTHGRGGFEHWLLGSVAENVLRRATCPVLTVPRRMSEPNGDRLVMFKSIVCAIDFSRDSQRALHYALSLAQAAAGRLILVHALEQFEGEEPVVTAHFDVPEFRRRLERDARQRLEDMIPLSARAWCETNVVVAHGKASREVLRVAQAYDADLIVLGVHGRNAVDLLLFGSTTQHVLHQARIPVLTVPRDVKTAAIAA